LYETRKLEGPSKAGKKVYDEFEKVVKLEKLERKDDT
jgi:hypothetical protein